MNRLLALILFSGALALPALPVHADDEGVGGYSDRERRQLDSLSAKDTVYETLDKALRRVHADATDDLSKAAESGTASEVEAALSAGADPGARRGFADSTPLHVAAIRNSNPAVITALIEGGAAPGARDGWGNTPLHMAVIDNLSAMETGLVLASESGALTEDEEALFTEGLAAMRRLPAGMRNSNPSVITALIEGGADPAARNEDGATPLHVAAATGSNPSVITALIEAGADPAARDDMGFTPFDYAREGGGAQGWPVGGLGNEALKGTETYWLLNEARFE